MWCDGRRGPEVGEVAVVPEDELGEDDVLDDGVEQEVGQPHEASEDGAEEEAWKGKRHNLEVIHATRRFRSKVESNEVTGNLRLSTLSLLRFLNPERAHATVEVLLRYFVENWRPRSPQGRSLGCQTCEPERSTIIRLFLHLDISQVQVYYSLQNCSISITCAVERKRLYEQYEDNFLWEVFRPH